MKFRESGRRAIKVEYWQKQIKEWQASGLSQKEFCRHRSLALSTFCYWKRKINTDERSTPQFYPLTLPAVPTTSVDAGLVLIVGSRQFQVQIRNNFSSTVLKKVIATLEQL